MGLFKKLFRGATREGAVEQMVGEKVAIRWVANQHLPGWIARHELIVGTLVGFDPATRRVRLTDAEISGEVLAPGDPYRLDIETYGVPIDLMVLLQDANALSRMWRWG